jgi:hypothetical protein
MLREALRRDPDDRVVPDLLELALSFVSTDPRGSGPAARLAHNLAYDVTLVRLCDHLGIGHDLTGNRAGPLARSHAEADLSAHLPALRELAQSQHLRTEY